MTAVFVTYNSARVLPEALRALPAAMEGLPAFEVVIADNASTDDSVAVARRVWRGATIVQVGRNLGYAAGINAAVRASSATDAILVLNPDVRLQPGSVASMAAVLSTPGVGIAVPLITGTDGELDYSLRREPTILRALGEAAIGGRLAGRWPPFGEVERRRDRYQRPSTADWAVGAVMLIDRVCLETVGPWDEGFFLYSEETDFALRARDQGFRVRLAPEARAMHVRGSAPVDPRLWSILQYNRFVLYRQRHGRLSALAFRLALLLNAGLRAPRSRVHRAATLALLLPGRGRRLATAPGSSVAPDDLST